MCPGGVETIVVYSCAASARPVTAESDCTWGLGRDLGVWLGDPFVRPQTSQSGEIHWLGRPDIQVQTPFGGIPCSYTRFKLFQGFSHLTWSGVWPSSQPFGCSRPSCLPSWAAVRAFQGPPGLEARARQPLIRFSLILSFSLIWSKSPTVPLTQLDSTVFLSPHVLLSVT